MERRGIVRKEKVKELLQALKGVKVLALGDVMVDEFLRGQVERISPEAPVPILEFCSHVFLPGGAANAAVNIKSLGGEPVLVGCVGKDAVAEKLREDLKERSIENHLVSDSGRPTILKTRVIAHSQQLVRIDREVRSPLPDLLLEKLQTQAMGLLDSIEGILISDYQKGTLTTSLVQGLVKEVNKRGLPVVIDSKSADLNLFKSATLLTPNLMEASLLYGKTLDNNHDEKVEEAGSFLLKELQVKGVLITRAEKGMTLFAPELTHHIPALSAEVHDVTGAGDSVAAAAVLTLAAGGSMLEAAELANLAAAVVVRKVGTAAASPREILNLLDEHFS